MKVRVSLAIAVFAAALPALAQTCSSSQVLVANKCTFTSTLGWIAAGGGTQSLFSIYVPPSASGPIDFEVTALGSSLGTAYTGYLGFRGSVPGTSESGILTLSDIVAGGDDSIGLLYPGELQQFLITQVCWDPTCTSAAPAGAVPNMISLQLSMASSVSGDVTLTPTPALTIQFVNGNQVTFEETENGIKTNSLFDYIPGINLGATPSTRYDYNGAAVAHPFDAISISNINNPNPISGTVTIQDVNGTTIATASVPAILPGGAAGYLLIGRTPGDSLGLFPSTLVLPAGTDGIFHGTLVVGMNGQTANGQCIVLAQEYYGNTMLNLTVYHGPVP